METQIDTSKQYVKNFVYKYEQYIDPKWVNLEEIVEHISNTIPEKISVNEFYNYVADYCVSKTSVHPNYNVLASRICVDRLHESTPNNMLDAVEILFNNNGSENPIVSKALLNNVKRFHKKIDDAIDMNRDYLFDYFGMRTLERSYLLKIHDNKKKKQIIERPQFMIMRVAMGIHGANIDSVIETYDLISQKYFTHATPTLFNSGTPRPQFSSCFLQGMDDSLDSITTQIKLIAMTSKYAGGIGVHLTSVRSRGSIIKGTNGLSEGIIPLCGVLNKLSKYVNQGGKRPGSIAVYLETWCADIYEFIELRKANTGNDDNRARDLFLALWISDLFMKRVKDNGVWSLMCPNECPGLEKCHGDEFEKLYTRYEIEQKYRKQVPARDLWRHILECQIETGFPYMCYKDNANNKSNQKNLGTIRSSNLCAEIIEYSDNENTAVCNLASICLPKYITKNEDGSVHFNYDTLIDVVRVIVRNLNKIIDINFYPTEIAEKTNKKHRPIGIGVQGLADVYNIFNYPYDSPEAATLNKKIFETIYFGAVDESKEIAKKLGHYVSYKGSPFSQGKLQFHLWGMNVSDLETKDMFDWDTLIADVAKCGTRNSLLTALMPTAGTSQLMKCYESFEPYISNIFVKTTMAGEFIVINEHLVNNLISLNLWDEDMRKLIIINNGSIQNIDKIPQNIKNIYKTAFELKLKSLISQSADRGPFVDQSQSMNLFMKVPDPTILTSAHFYGWERGLKTGMYYLRGSSSVNPIQFGIDIEDIVRLTGRSNAMELITGEYGLDNKDNEDDLGNLDDLKPKSKMCKFIPGQQAEGCLMCSS
jgi:ribonucleoside-diphosphate reductase alpha chain